MPRGTQASTHPLTLVFDDWELERAYVASRGPSPRTLTVGTLVMVLSWLAAAGWAWVVAPGDAELFSWGVAVIAVGLVATIPPVWLVPSARVAQVSSSLGVILVVGVAMVMEWHVHEPMTHYIQPAFALMLMNTQLLIPADFVFKQVLTWALATSWIIVVALTPGGSVVDAVFWVGAAQIVGTFVVFTTERQRRRIFVQRRIIAEERAKSEQLLRNMLPPSIAERLKREAALIADRFDNVTVLFADIVGFTSLSATLAPERVVELLNQVFTRFDELAARHRVEKIKTIGDAYMVVAGLPEPRADHAQAAAEMALDLRAAIGELSRTVDHPLQVRIGMCSGPAVAGVIGTQKFAYDLWGDTVNTAARMESHGMPGEIHVTESTYQLLHERYAFGDRGVIDVKGKGPMRTYFLQGRREPS